MMPDDPNFIAFEAPGTTLFIVENDRVLILGDDGTEAQFPVSDLDAFIAHLANRPPAPELPAEGP